LLKVLYITPRTHVTLLMLLLLFLNQISEDRKQEVLIRKKNPFSVGFLSGVRFLRWFSYTW